MECFIKIINSSEFLFLIAGIIIFLNCIKKNNNFFDIRRIVIEHFEMFSNAKGQIVVFYGTPLLLAIAVLKNNCINKDIIDNIVIMLSIIIAMLFAMLSILNSYQNKDSEYVKVLEETYNTILFQCIICVLTLIISFSQYFVDNYDSELVLKIVSFLLYYMIFVLIMNIFIILKRMKALFDNR